MIFPKGATIKFTSDTKNCFVKIPREWRIIGEPPFHLEIEYGSNLKCCLTWAGETNNNVDEIEINGMFGNKLGLKDGDNICVSCTSNRTIGFCEKAILEPDSADDWEITELNTSHIERELMNQIKVIWSNLSFPIWVNKSTCIFVHVRTTEPNTAPLVLRTGTELSISPFVEKRSDETKGQYVQTETESVENPKVTNFFSSIFSTIVRSVGYDHDDGFVESKTETERNDATKEQPKTPIPKVTDLVLRVAPLTDIIDNSRGVSSVIYVNDVDLPTSLRHNGTDNFVASIRKVLSPYEKFESNGKKPTMATSAGKKGDTMAGNSNRENAEQGSCSFETTVVRVFVLKRTILNHGLVNLNPGYVATSDELRRQLGLEMTSNIVIKSLDYRHSILSHLKLHPLISMASWEDKNVIPSFKNWLTENGSENTIVISKGTMIRLTNEKGKHLDLILMPTNGDNKTIENQDAYYHLSRNTIDVVNVQIGEKITPIYKPWDVRLPCKTLTELDVQPYGRKLITLGGVDHVSKDILEFVNFSLGLSQIANQIREHPLFKVALLCGPKGVGKTTLAKAICRELQDTNHRVYSQILDCKQLRGKRADSIKKIWGGAFAEAAHRQPSIVLLEDLDTAATAIASPEQEGSPDALYFGKVAATLLSILEYFRDSKTRVVVLATAKAEKSLHPSLSDTRGRHVFSNVFELKSPNVDERENILRAVILNKTTVSPLSLDEIDVSKIASKTEGFVTRDLEMVVDRAIHFHAVRVYNTELEEEQKNEVKLVENDFVKALNNFTPHSLHGVKLHSDTRKDWSDVGGLTAVKKIIEQTLTWPLKYPKLFSSCPLRPQSGLLLYGAPGTGKTLLATVVASQCQQNFISIKGPELLSKYIGASEQAVRDVFNRAQSAKPCVVFFDEFDAIAPRRGHDSTGVTDRVVNQLLTQMDGVETLQGVSVLAATSRPDLIDPALLRPGRLDKCVNCPLPDEMDREAILRSLSRHLNLDHSVDLGVIAQQTENFTGADLQALLYTAHIDALNETLDKRANQKNDTVEVDTADDNMIYYPTLKDGPKELKGEEKQKIRDEVNTLMENMFGAPLPQNESDKNKERRKSGAISTLIRMSHLTKAVIETKPSVSPEERMRYRAIYERFSRNKGDQSVKGGTTVTTQKRVTLA